MVCGARAVLSSLFDPPPFYQEALLRLKVDHLAFSPASTSAPHGRFEQRRVGCQPQGRETCCEFIFQYNQSHSPLCAFRLLRVETVVNMYLYVVMHDDNRRI